MKKTRLIAALAAVLIAGLAFFAATVPAYAAEPEGQLLIAEGPEETSGGSVTGTKAISAAVVVGIAAAAGAIAMGFAVSKSNESMARQPEAAGQINSSMMLGLVFIETLAIYALIVAILIIFVL
ncbi:MAG: ATP synthase F0 subunit C [Lachnospiraceae bacterium]|nr:ATP synthase F0 subunit C [Lachnospiraceae bacterium]